MKHQQTAGPRADRDRRPLHRRAEAGGRRLRTVYKARDKELGRALVAIKTIRLEGLAAASAPMEDLLKRFKQ